MHKSSAHVFIDSYKPRLSSGLFQALCLMDSVRTLSRRSKAGRERDQKRLSENGCSLNSSFTSLHSFTLKRGSGKKDLEQKSSQRETKVKIFSLNIYWYKEVQILLVLFVQVLRYVSRLYLTSVEVSGNVLCSAQT